MAWTEQKLNNGLKQFVKKSKNPVDLTVYKKLEKPNKLITVYTIQPESVWIHLKTHGFYFPDLSKSVLLTNHGTFDAPQFVYAYQWLCKQFEKRKHLPMNASIWVWQKYGNKTFFKHPEFKDVPNQVLLELAVDPKILLLSDFDNWNSCLNYGLVSDDEQEIDNFYACCDMMTADMYKETVEKSWNRIFDVSKSDYVQGVMPFINYAQIKKVMIQRKNHHPKIIIPKKKIFNI